MSAFRKGQTVTVLRASYYSTTPAVPKKAVVTKVTRAGEVHIEGWEFAFHAESGRQIIPVDHEKALTYRAWIAQ